MTQKLWMVARLAMPVLMGATADGTTELIAMADGRRESGRNWTALMRFNFECSAV